MATVDTQVDRDDRQAFGAFLASLRLHAGAKKIKQTRILAHLPHWVHSSYSRLEDGVTSPRFSDLPALYAAFLEAGVVFSPPARQQFVALARKRIELQHTYKDRRTDAEWAQLQLDLMRLDGQAEIEQQGRSSQPFLADVGHLVDRPLWHEELKGMLSSARGKKLVIVRGSAGVGKSSELSRLATYLLGQSSCQMIFCNLLLHERTRTPEEVLEELLGTIFRELGVPLPQMPALSFEDQTALLLEQFEHMEQRLVLLIDHGECLISEHHRLASCWEHFFSAFLRGRHQAKIVLATRLWLGWAGNDPLFVDETTIPPLSEEQAVCLLQRLGLQEAPVSLLQEVYRSIGGIPLCLEWVAALVKRPQEDDWESFEMEDTEVTQAIASPTMMTKNLQRLLASPRVFGGPPESVVTPFLERLLSSQSLSADALYVLRVLSQAAIPLAKPALSIICRSGPGPYEELRRASLVVASRARTQLLPMVAASVARSLSREQTWEGEHLLIEAYTAWLVSGMVSEREAGGIVAELATLLFKHHRLLAAGQLLIRYGWLAFNLGYAPRLARLATEVLDQFEWYTTEEDECGGLLLSHFLPPFLGRPIDDGKKVAAYRRIREAILAEKIAFQPSIEVAVTYHLMQCAMNELRFEEAQLLLEACCDRLQPGHESNLDLQASLLEKRAWLLGRWGEYAEEREEAERAEALQEQAIALNRRIVALLSTSGGQSPLEKSFLNKRLARALNNLGYHLGRIGQEEEALHALNRSIDLKERSYVELDTLADAYGEKSQVLARLGRFQEALVFDEKAYAEVQRLANVGYTFAQQELPTYQVNRGCLYLRMGRRDEAERLLREAEERVRPGRRMYRVFAKRALDEIEQWREHDGAARHQLDWRWVERYRALAAFDSYWWWTATGSFSEEEQRRWKQLFASELDEATKERLGTLLASSRECELAAALAEQREPHLHYPAIDIEEVRVRVKALQQLDTEISQDEPNAIVRKIYHATIAEEVDFLRMIEATYEGETEKYWQCSLRFTPVPTRKEMEYALSRVRHYLLQGLLRPEMAEASERVIQLVREQLGLALDLSYDEHEAQALQQVVPLSSSQPRRMVSPQTARRFFEAVLREHGYEEWQVIIDPNASVPRIEQGLRHVYLPAKPISVQQIKSDLSHELAGHVARCIGGERSLLGLLGIHTARSLETEEGLASYYDMQTARLAGQPHDETSVWFGTLATGLASGVITPPQTFLPLFTFFEAFIFLYRLLRRPDQDAQTAQQFARKLAFERSLRTFRGVPDLSRTGVCYTKDALYLRGLWKIEQAVAQDETVLDRLAVGVVALEYLPDLLELGIVSAPQPLRQLALNPDLDAYIISFEESDERPMPM
jgi:tetratricopeptide (TPR) repeat protein